MYGIQGKMTAILNSSMDPKKLDTRIRAINSPKDLCQEHRSRIYFMSPSRFPVKEVFFIDLHQNPGSSIIIKLQRH